MLNSVNPVKCIKFIVNNTSQFIGKGPDNFYHRWFFRFIGSQTTRIHTDR